MLYCRYHDLAFCSAHLGQCLRPDCRLVDDPRSQFCSICSGILAPKKTQADRDEETQDKESYERK